MAAIWWNRGGASAGRPKAGSRGRARGRLRGAVEALEPRALMAAFSVTSAADAGAGSLREAIVEASRLPGEAHVITIDFDPADAGPIVLASPLPILVGEVEISAPEGTRVTLVRGDGPEVPPFRILRVAEGATVRLNRLTISGGEAQLGGGIFNEGTLTLFQSEVAANVASAKGGGIFNAGALTIALSTVRDNVAEGVRTIGFGPAGIGRGGGIFSTGSLTVSQSTLSGNVANREGGAIFSNVNRPRVEPSYVRSSILADNAIGDVVVRRGPFESRGNNLLGEASGLEAGPTDLLGVDPLLAPPGRYGGEVVVRPPLPGSPAIDAGGYSPSFGVDARGMARGPETTDIGAAEAAPFALIAASGGDQAATIGASFAEPLVLRVEPGDTASPAGGRITFRAPAEGPSATLIGNPATLDVDGIARVVAVANDMPGTYEVVVEAPGATGPASFTLTNLAPEPADSPGEPVAAGSASASASPSGPRALIRSAREVARDLRTGLPDPSRVGPALRARADAMARTLLRDARQAMPEATRLPPAPARAPAQARARNGASSTPGTPISTTWTDPV